MTKLCVQLFTYIMYCEEFTLYLFCFFFPALELIKIRSQAMQLACEIAPGGMASIMYGPDSQLNLAMKRAKEWCVDRGIPEPECRVANYLFPHCKVIAGHKEVRSWKKKAPMEISLSLN